MRETTICAIYLVGSIPPDNLRGQMFFHHAVRASRRSNSLQNPMPLTLLAALMKTQPGFKLHPFQSWHAMALFDHRDRPRQRL
jgi:hypothetical protein